MGKIVDTNFRTPWWLRSPHLQTLWGPLRRPAPTVTRRRETLRLADGDHLLLDWAGPAATPGALRVLVLHGLSGSSDSLYVRGTQARLAAIGVTSVAMNSRGAAQPNDTALSSHAGETDDVDAVISHLRAGNGPRGPLVAIGVSLGGSRLLNWLARRDNGALDAAAAVCSPLDLAACADRLDRGFSKVYRRHLLDELLAHVHCQHRHLAINHPLQAARLAALDLRGIRSFRQFDTQVIAPLYGFRDAADYYKRCSCGPHLHAITTPTLMIQAADDPFMSSTSLPNANDLGPGIILETSRGGGHVGFVAGTPWRPEYWLEARLVRFVTGYR